ncbi:MAG: prepilin-type N-terminal cleavage/methylation domain-containing protein [Anaeromicrobium sp.]|jgi:prepilin-type N-terminal cleavage/methylation domain-containing protein|uniref:PilW family protein n=1 Tax=Anaeromicrobium sp. TaxID=1929132 RepID=UPI0025CF61DD|nr:prepilin-type N-terminal cleavage/methylation domain-containing protein [Anaeromicrobium sp.]MCT4595177.1 prepilin-type N-terminal cleavage/methylation domain-containing protein [Anaeromicrobium sp.]
MKYKKHNNKGFTLIELLIVIGIMGVIITAIFSFFISNLKTFNRADDHIQAQNNAQAAMNIIIGDIIGGQGLVRNENNRVVLKISDAKSITYDYDKDDQSISRRDTSEVIARNITDFHVSGNGNGVTITITSEINDAKVSLKNNIYFRNGN